MTEWSKRTLTWIEDETAFVSVPFTWNLPRAFSQCVWLKQQGYHVRAGGPAVSLIPDYLQDVTEIGGEVEALSRHNPEATVTTRGCVRQCSFCAVPKIEGEFRELPVWEPRRIICDNNLLASSHRHFDRVIDSLKGSSGVDFNQGLDKRELKPYHIDRLKELDKPHIRFSWDDINEESLIFEGVRKFIEAGFPHSRITIYILIGYNDTPENALYQMVTVRDILKVTPFPMRFQPLYELKYNSYIAPGWTDKELRRMVRYWSRQRFLRQIPYAGYDEAKR